MDKKSSFFKMKVAALVPRARKILTMFVQASLQSRTPRYETRLYHKEAPIKDKEGMK